MSSFQSLRLDSQGEQLLFWAIGDFHFRALPAWNEVHTQRLAPLFSDLHELWQREGQPAFCVSPGDIVEMGLPENHQVAYERLHTQLGEVPFYPGIGNHEYHLPGLTESGNTMEVFTAIWKKPPRYTWTAGEFLFVMLDYPDPFTLQDPERVFVSHETLEFLDTALRKHADWPTVLFLHCPLYNTVLDRDAEQHRDYNSLQHFFSPENSAEIRAILARHRNAHLLFSGHTHSGWEAPHLVHTEQLGDHPVTFVNLMSPWYTGRHTGPRLIDDNTVNYIPDTPDVVPSFAIYLSRERARIRLRDHQSKRWLKEWTVSL